MKADRFFNWDIVQINRERIDWMIYNISMKFAKEEYIKNAKPCPQCGKDPEDLFWLGFQTSNESWDRGEGRAGFLTICDECKMQVDFFRNEDLEQSIIEGGVRL